MRWLLLLLRRRLLLLLLLRRLLLLLLLLLRRRLAPLLLPLLLLPLDMKATRAAAVALALAGTAAPAPRARGYSRNVLLQQVLLLSNKHGRLSFVFGHEALLDLARVNGKADDLLVELAARNGNVLAKIFQQNFNQILGLAMELFHVINVVLVDTLVKRRTAGDLNHDMIEYL